MSRRNIYELTVDELKVIIIEKKIDTEAIRYKTSNRKTGAVKGEIKRSKTSLIKYILKNTVEGEIYREKKDTRKERKGSPPEPPEIKETPEPPEIKEQPEPQEIKESPEPQEIKEPPALPEIKEPPALPEIKEQPALPEIKEQPAPPEIKEQPALPEIKEQPAPPEIKEPPETIESINKKLDETIIRLRTSTEKTESLYTKIGLFHMLIGIYCIWSIVNGVLNYLV
jgi:hypothetical protein